MRDTRFGAAFFVASICTLVSAQGAVLFQENFDGGLRPKGNGELRSADANKSISGFWVQFPGIESVKWAAPDGAVDTINFGSQTFNPLEPPLPGQPAPDPGNGIAYGKGTGSASAPFTSIPGESYLLTSAVLTPNNYVGNPNPGADLVRLGFASASALGNNLADNGIAWVTLKNTGEFELHTATSSTSQQVPGFIPGFFTPLVQVALGYDSSAGEVFAYTDASPRVSLPLKSFSPQFVGFDVNAVTNGGIIGTVGFLRVTNEIPEPTGLAMLTGTLFLLRRRRATA